jgi:transglutaminase/protease-like cytokinesis protein 3
VGRGKGNTSGYGYGKLTDELKNKIKQKKAKFDAEVNRIISTIPANAPDIWKEKLIYDRILMDSHYNLSGKWDGLADDNWTAYGVIVNKYGVCESYSEAFQTLCLYVGINCITVSGSAGGPHTWNCVQIDGEWYMCDITFDDPVGAEEGVAEWHTSFNLTSQEMKEDDHKWNIDEYPVPKCTATKYSYRNYFGK